MIAKVRGLDCAAIDASPLPNAVLKLGRIEIYLFWFRLGNGFLIISSVALFTVTVIERVFIGYYAYSIQQLAISALLFIAAVSGIIGTRRLRRDLNEDADGKRTCAQRKTRASCEPPTAAARTP